MIAARRNFACFPLWILTIGCLTSFLAAEIRAEDHFWSSLGGGSFNFWLNWVPQWVPGSDDRAIFELGMDPAYEVTFYESVTNHECLFRNDKVILNLGGNTYTLNNTSFALIVGEGAGQVAEVLFYNGAIDTTVTHVGLWDDSFGMFDLDSDLTLNISDHLSVGNDGDGVMFIRDGVSVTTEYAAMGGHDFGNTGVLYVQGPDAEFTVNETFRVGVEGKGYLYLQNGANAHATRGYIGDWPLGYGELYITLGAKLTMGEWLMTGGFGEGLLEVREAGKLELQNLSIGGEEGGEGQVNLFHDGSRIDAVHNVYVGDRGHGVMHVSQEADLTAEMLIVGGSETAQGEMTLSGAEAAVTYLLIVGDWGHGTMNVSQQADVTVDSLLVGPQETGDGVLNISGSGTTVTTVNGIQAGTRGHAEIFITDGADVRTTQPGGWIGIGGESNSDGYVLVDGGSTLAAEQAPLVVGDYGQAELVISGGSSVYSSGELFMGWGDCVAHMTISGEGSSYTCGTGYEALIGEAGQADLLIENGGYFQKAGGAVHIGGQASGVGTVALHGVNSVYKGQHLSVGERGVGRFEINDARVALGNVDPIDVPSGELHIGDWEGQLSGTGTVVGNVENLAGRIMPGGRVDPALAGILTIDGDYTQHDTAFMTIKMTGPVAGEEYSVLNVTGTATLANVLDMWHVDGYFPPIGEQYTILTADTINGTFDVIGPGWFEAAYNQNDVTITVLMSPGDLDGDNDVDLADLAQLLGHYGMTGAAYTDGDIDRDGVVDLADLAALLGNYGKQA